MKDRCLGWVTAVMYSHEGKLYVREKDDFIKKFKKSKGEGVIALSSFFNPPEWIFS